MRDDSGKRSDVSGVLVLEGDNERDFDPFLCSTCKDWSSGASVPAELDILDCPGEFNEMVPNPQEVQSLAIKILLDLAALISYHPVSLPFL